MMKVAMRYPPARGDGSTQTDQLARTRATGTACIQRLIRSRTLASTALQRAQSIGHASLTYTHTHTHAV